MTKRNHTPDNTRYNTCARLIDVFIELSIKKKKSGALKIQDPKMTDQENHKITRPEFR